MLKDQLKLLRETKKLTKKQVAEKIGVSERAYITYEYGERDVSTEVLTKIAKFYGVTTDYLLGLENENKKGPSPIEQLADEFNLDLLERKILDNYLSLPDNLRGNLIEFLAQSVKEVQLESNPNTAESLYAKLDDDDKAEIRVRMRDMLKDEKYSAKEKSSIG